MKLRSSNLANGSSVAVVDAIRRLPDKQSAADPIPTSVLKQIADVIAPFIVEMFNRSLSEGHFPAVFKKAFITPDMKKPGLDAADTSSYRPISNLPVVKAPGTSRSPPTDGVPVVR